MKDIKQNDDMLTDIAAPLKLIQINTFYNLSILNLQ